MDIRKIKKLIELLEESGIAEIEIKEGEEALRISRMPTGTATGHQAPQLAHLAPLAAGAGWRRLRPVRAGLPPQRPRRCPPPRAQPPNLSPTST